MLLKYTIGSLLMAFRKACAYRYDRGGNLARAKLVPVK
jgi:hypothetical protein